MREIDIDRDESSESAFSSSAGVGRNRQNIGMLRAAVVRFSQKTHTVGQQPIKVLSASRYRKYFLAQNQSQDVVYLGFGMRIDSAGNNGFAIAPGGFYELDTVIPFDSVFISGASSGQRVLITEGLLSEQ